MRFQKVIGCLFLSCLIFLFFWEIYDREELSNSCLSFDSDFQQTIITHTITLSPEKKPINYNNVWNSSYSFIINPDSSYTYFLTNICFDLSSNIYIFNDYIDYRFKINHHAISNQSFIDIVPFSKPFHGTVILLNIDFEISKHKFIEKTMMIWDIRRQIDVFKISNNIKSINSLIITSEIDRNEIHPFFNDFLTFLTNNFVEIVWLNQSNLFSKQYGCSQSCIVVDDKKEYFSGPSSAEAFKSLIYDSLSIERPSKKGWNKELGYIPTITLFYPSDISEEYFILNFDSIISILDYYSLNYEIISEWNNLSLIENILLFKNTDVLIHPHGPFGMNYLWLEAHTSVIELLPNSLFNNQYELIAKSILLNYQAVRCENTDISNIIIPLNQLELSIIESLDMQGISIRTRVDKLLYSNSL